MEDRFVSFDNEVSELLFTCMMLDFILNVIRDSIRSYLYENSGMAVETIQRYYCSSMIFVF